MKIKITKRDIVFLIIGIFTWLLIDSVWNWNSSVESFNEGRNAARSSAGK